MKSGNSSAESGGPHSTHSESGRLLYEAYKEHLWQTSTPRTRDISILPRWIDLTEENREFWNTVAQNFLKGLE
jgi:hypothetical protein